MTSLMTKVLFCTSFLCIFYIAKSIAMSPERVNVDTNKAKDPSYTNSAAPADTYAMFKQLMDVREDMEGDSEEDKNREPRVVTTLKNAFQSLLEVAFKGFFVGFMPHVQRQKRETTDDDARSYLDIAIGALGALMGRQGCSDKIACRYGKVDFSLSYFSLCASQQNSKNTEKLVLTGEVLVRLTPHPGLVQG